MAYAKAGILGWSARLRRFTCLSLVHAKPNQARESLARLRHDVCSLVVFKHILIFSHNVVAGRPDVQRLFRAIPREMVACDLRPDTAPKMLGLAR